MNLYAVIMAGGSGTRFWPLSRGDHPKQFLKIGSKKTLLERTVDRVRSLVGIESIFIVTASALREKTLETVPQIPAANIIGEPVGRDTANAVAALPGF